MDTIFCLVHGTYKVFVNSSQGVSPLVRLLSVLWLWDTLHLGT